MLSQKNKKVNAYTDIWLKLAKKIQNLTSDLQHPTHGDIHISGPPNDTARTDVFSQIATSLPNQNRAIFWLCKNDEEAKSVYENLKFWQKIKKSKMAIRLLNPEHPTELSIINYQLLVPNVSLIITATLENLLKLQPPTEFKKSITTIKQNNTLNSRALTQKLIDIGYERNTTADSPGTFALRGSILDIWTPQLKSPVRIEIEFNKIVSIKEFDPVTKKQKAKLGMVDIIPAAPQKPESLKALKQNDIKTIGHWSNEAIQPFGFAQGLRQFNNLTIILTDPDDQTLNQLKGGTPKIIFQTLDSTIINYQLSIINPPLYHNNLNQFISDLKEYQNKKYKIILVTNQKKSLKRLFEEKGISNYQLSIINYLPRGNSRNQLSHLNGFISKSPNLLFLTDLEIFGKTEIKKPTKTSSTKHQAIQSLSIRPGDYVIHIDHGIARFQGTTKQKVDEIEREYFILEYALGDKLYVPVELADKIEKYIGLAQPHLHRLSGGMWYLAKKKIKEQTEKIAKELLELYAQRELATVNPLRKKTFEEKELENSFAYEETADQARAIGEIEHDLEQDKPMDRLVCGDVGFGKTEVAIRAAFKTVMNGKQVVLIAPTTILAQQHFDTFKQRLEKFPVMIEVLSRFKSKTQIQKNIAQIKAGVIDIVIGTHRVLSGDVQFKNLGLIIIDEEQRFGVEHKEKLKKLRKQAHILTLTATPIPRTLHLSLTGLRDISVIETPPVGRKEIRTIIKQYDEADIKQAIKRELERQGQIYFVHNKVETIKIFTRKLQELLPRVTLGIAHGQMPENELAKVMADFDNRKIDVLICSTIIENGLDLPNVNTLIVDDATKFGLSQLYQLRGRVGRSDRQAYAYFFYRRLQPAGAENNQQRPVGIDCNQPLQCNRGLTEKELKRLQALQESEKLGSGFALAMRDLEIRGVGDILGKKQHGCVAAIGLSLYTRLLAQKIEELKTGVKPKPIPEISIDLPLELGIPPEVEPNEVKRLNLYQRLASITDLNELASIRDSFACPPKLQRRGAKKYSLNIRETDSRRIREKFNNLFHILEIKLLAQQTNIASISTTVGFSTGKREKKIVIKFKNEVGSQNFVTLLNHNPHWKFSGNQIKIMMNNLGDNWIEQLKKCLKIFRK